MLFDRTIPAFAVTFLLLAVSPSHAQDPQQESSSKPQDSSSKPASPPDDMKPKSTAKQKKDTATKNAADQPACWFRRSEEHTSELQSRVDLVCRLLLEKKKKHKPTHRQTEHN